MPAKGSTMQWFFSGMLLDSNHNRVWLAPSYASFFFFFLTAFLKYNGNTGNCTYLECTIWWVLHMFTLMKISPNQNNEHIYHPQKFEYFSIRLAFQCFGCPLAPQRPCPCATTRVKLLLFPQSKLPFSKHY